MDDPLHPIGGPAALHGAELAADPAWRRRLTAAEIETLLRVTAAAEALPVAGFSPRRFPLPELAPLFAWMARQLEHGPGVVRLSGLPVERLSPAALRRLFWGFCANFGPPVLQTAAGEILGEVKDETGSGMALAGAESGPVHSARSIARSTGPLRFHTDKCDLLCLLCAGNGIAGGVSRIVSSVTIHDEIARRRPDLLRVLYRPFWRMRPADEEGQQQDPVFAMPVFARGPEGGFTSQYSRTYVTQAQTVPDVPRLTPEMVAAMDLMAAVAEEVCLEAPFEVGDMQFLNQHVTYHGRTAFQDGGPAASRVLLRIWLSAPFTRALPAGHAVQWGDVRAGALRGGAVVGRSAIAA